MSGRTVTLEVNSPEQEALLRQFHSMVMEMEALALAAPSGQVMDQCEAAILDKGQRVNRQVLQEAVQRRIEALEKKGRRTAPVAVAESGKIAALPRDKS
jgi:hypothetical protein